MGINYGQFRNRSEDLRSLPGTVLESLGDDNLRYEKYDYEETAALINENLDRVQAEYNARFNYPPPNHECTANKSVLDS